MNELSYQPPDSLIDHDQPSEAAEAFDAFQAASDELLLLGARLRDEIALAVFYDRYGSLIYSLALRIVRDRDLAEQVMQEVFLRCWEGRERYHPALGSPPAWLLGMTRAFALDVARDGLALVTGSIGADDRLRGEPTRDAPERDEAVVLRAMVSQALTVLSGSERAAIELAYYGGLTREEVASRLGQSPASVGIQIRDGLRRLRQTLAPVIGAATADASSAA